MKKTEKTIAEMKSEYDFTGRKGERGKYYEAYRRGHTVRIHEEDGTVTTQYFGLDDGAVMLEVTSTVTAPLLTVCVTLSEPEATALSPE